MDDGSCNVVAFLNAVTGVQHTFLQLANDLAEAGLIVDQHEPYVRISLHAWRYLEIGVEVDTAAGRRYNFRLTVDWCDERWQIRVDAASQVVRDAIWDAASYRPDSPGLPVRSVTTLDGLATALREAVVSGRDAFRQLLAPGGTAGQDTEPRPAPAPAT